MNYKKVVFYNNLRNGDIHVSRSFVKKLTEIFIQNNKEVHYFHPNDVDILSDIPGLVSERKEIPSKNYINYFINNDTIYINTWYCSNAKIFNKFGISFDTLYYIFADIFKYILGMEISSVGSAQSFYPCIDLPHYEKNIKNINLINNFDKKIFVSNGVPRSNQTKCPKLDDVILHLAKIHKNKLFILTNETSKKISDYENVIFSSDIIDKAGCDLNENGYLSTKCDLIIGSASGPFTFAMCKENYFNKEKTIITFSNLSKPSVGSFWLGDWGSKNIIYEAKVIESDMVNESDICKLIDENI